MYYDEPEIRLRKSASSDPIQAKDYTASMGLMG